MNIGNKVRITTLAEGSGSRGEVLKRFTGIVAYIEDYFFTLQGQKYRESFRYADEMTGDIRIEVLG